MASNIYDVAIIGSGMAGTILASKIAKERKDLKTILIEAGRPPLKRRHQMMGYFGCFPSGDGKLYTHDVDKVSKLTGIRKAKTASTWINNFLSNYLDLKLVKDTTPNNNILKKIKLQELEFYKNDYFQLYPKDIHFLCKQTSNLITDAKHINYSFDNFVEKITKVKNQFLIETELESFVAKKVFICVGRSGWRWANSLYKDLELITSNDVMKFGIRAEMSAALLKDWNDSNCVVENKTLSIGPFNWRGTVIPEDHIDFACSSFRGNESRWDTEKVSFPIIWNKKSPKNGWEETERIAKLVFLIANDRVIKEKVSTLINNKSKISDLQEYKQFVEILKSLNTLIPDLTSKANFYVPEIVTIAPDINIKNTMETDIANMYVCGESAGISGLLSAAITAIVALDSI